MIGLINAGLTQDCTKKDCQFIWWHGWHWWWSFLALLFFHL